MYYDIFNGPGRPGGSYATHPAHGVFHEVFIVITSVDLFLQAYTVYLMLRVAKSELNEYRYFMIFSTVIEPC